MSSYHLYERMEIMTLDEIKPIHQKVVEATKIQFPGVAVEIRTVKNKTTMVYYERRSNRLKWFEIKKFVEALLNDAA